MSKKDKTIQSSWEGKLVQPLWRTVWSFLMKLKKYVKFKNKIKLKKKRN